MTNLLACKVYQEEYNWRQKLWAMMWWTWWAGIPVATFPIKKRIKTELFILIGNRGLMYKMQIKKWIKKLSDLIEEGKLKWCEKLSGNENIMVACLELLTLHGRKDKLTAACLERLSLKSKKYHNVKKWFFEQIIWYYKNHYHLGMSFLNNNLDWFMWKILFLKELNVVMRIAPRF